METFPTAMRHATEEFLGLELPDFKVEQEILKLKVILMYGSANTTEKQLFSTTCNRNNYRRA